MKTLTFKERLDADIAHGVKLHIQGLKYGEINMLDKIISMLNNGDYKTGLDSLQAVLDLKYSTSKGE